MIDNENIIFADKNTCFVNIKTFNDILRVKLKKNINFSKHLVCVSRIGGREGVLLIYSIGFLLGYTFLLFCEFTTIFSTHDLEIMEDSGRNRKFLRQITFIERRRERREREREREIEREIESERE